MRNLILTLAILVSGIASAQVYGPINGVTFTVSGTTDLGITGTTTVTGDFSVVNANLLNDLRNYREDMVSGDLASADDFELYGDEPVITPAMLGMRPEEAAMLARVGYGTITFYDASGTIVHQAEILLATLGSIELSQDEEYISLPGHTWEIIIG